MTLLKYLFSGRRLLLTPFVLLAAAVMCGLGVWQINRLNQRLALNARIDAQMSADPVALTSGQIDPQTFDYRRVSVRGVYDPAHEVLLRNRSYNGATGYHLITPLRLTGSSETVLIDRGWIPLELSKPEDRKAFAPPTGEVEIIGVARRSQDGIGGPQDLPFTAERPRLDAWFHVDIPRIQQQTGYPLLPVFVELQPTAENTKALPGPSPTTDMGPGNHMSYVIQWFSFAAIAIFGYIALMRQQLKKQETSQTATQLSGMKYEL